MNNSQFISFLPNIRSYHLSSLKYMSKISARNALSLLSETMPICLIFYTISMSINPKESLFYFLSLLQNYHQMVIDLQLCYSNPSPIIFNSSKRALQRSFSCFYKIYLMSFVANGPIGVNHHFFV